MYPTRLAWQKETWGAKPTQVECANPASAFAPYQWQISGVENS